MEAAGTKRKRGEEGFYVARPDDCYHMDKWCESVCTMERTAERPDDRPPCPHCCRPPLYTHRELNRIGTTKVTLLSASLLHKANLEYSAWLRDRHERGPPKSWVIYPWTGNFHMALCRTVAPSAELVEELKGEYGFALCGPSGEPLENQNLLAVCARWMFCGFGWRAALCEWYVLVRTVLKFHKGADALLVALYREDTPTQHDHLLLRFKGSNPCTTLEAEALFKLAICQHHGHFPELRYDANICETGIEIWEDWEERVNVRFASFVSEHK